MEAKDLMIGDWVYSHQGVPSRVTSITCDGIIETEDGVSNIEIAEPIPITPEILEKNDFHKEVWSTSLWRRSLGCGRWCDISKMEGKWFFRIFNGDLFTCVKEIHFVHELQHILRLFKIDKAVGL